MSVVIMNGESIQQCRILMRIILIYTSMAKATKLKPHQITDTQYMGVYLRNNFKIDDHWILGLSGRHDWTQVEVDDISIYDAEKLGQCFRVMHL